MAAAEGANDQAGARYAAALAAAPTDRTIAGQAMGHGVRSGNWRLALDGARALERQNALLADARFLLVAEAFRAHDWRNARIQIDAIERDQSLAFTVPVLRAWLAYGAHDGDPLAALAAAGANGPAAGYAAEHRALLLLALGRPEGQAEMLAAARSAGPHAVRLRIAGASLLASRHQKDAALAMLDVDTPASRAARALIEANRPVPGSIGTAEAGVGELMVRLALDLGGQEMSQLGTLFSRLGTRLDPHSAEAWLVTAELLAQQDQHQLAVQVLDNVPAGDPFALAARDTRIRLLSEGDEQEAALTLARQAAEAGTARQSDWLRLGQLYGELGRQRDAADAFGRALAMHDGGEDEWQLQLMRGGALDQAGDWPGAREALRRAYALAPEQPYVLNYLGYALLIRNEEPADAERLIREAHRLAPDNAAITDSLGWALYHKGQLGEAIPLLEQAAQAEPSDVEINEHLGDAYYAAGRHIEARFAWRAASVYAEGATATRIAAKTDRGLTPELAAR
jgi:Flp pilus assembly protein TadD